MNRSDHYRRQHQELLAIVGSISATLSHQHLENESLELRSLLAKLSGKLRMHLAMEDKSMYPELLNAKDVNVSQVAKRYADEMGNIADVFKSYYEKWQAKEIELHPTDFVKETKNLFGVLGERIHKEENELYRFYDKM